MAEPRQLSRPPITEALVDFRTIPDPAVDAERLQPLREELKTDFPTFEEQKGFQTEFRIEGGKLVPPVAKDLGFHGLRLKSADGSQFVQFRPDGFTFNNIGLGRYLGGDRLLDEALRWWSRYAEIARPAAVVRLALRYLNRLDLPVGEDDEFGKFLTAPMEPPVGAPQRISSFVSRVVAHDDSEATVIITQKLELTDVFPPVPVIIDVDAFFTMELSPTPGVLRRHLETLRRVKNRTFFALLKPEAVNLYV